MYETDLRLIPAPDGGILTADDARAWLEDYAPDYLSALCYAMSEVQDARTREDFGMLAVEVRYMLEACSAALTGKPARVKETGPLDLSLAPRELASILAARSTEGEEACAHAYSQLAARLVALLSREAA